jgi:hypothetical protein
MPLQVGRAPLVTQYGVHEVQAAERTFFLTSEQLVPAQRDLDALHVQASHHSGSSSHCSVCVCARARAR